MNNMKMIMENWRRFASDIAAENEIDLSKLNVYIFHDKKTLKENKNLDPIKTKINLLKFMEKYERGTINEDRFFSIIKESADYDIKKAEKEYVNEVDVGAAVQKGKELVNKGVEKGKQIIGKVTDAFKQFSKKVLIGALKVVLGAIKMTQVAITLPLLLAGKVSALLIKALNYVVKWWNGLSPTSKIVVVGVAVMAIGVIAYLASKTSHAEAQAMADIMVAKVKLMCGGMSESQELFEAQLDCSSFDEKQVRTMCQQVHAMKNDDAVIGQLMKTAESLGQTKSSYTFGSHQVQDVTTTGGVQKINTDVDQAWIVFHSLADEKANSILQLIQTLKVQSNKPVDVANTFEPDQIKLLTNAIKDVNAAQKMGDSALLDALKQTSQEMQVYWNGHIKSVFESVEQAENVTNGGKAMIEKFHQYIKSDIISTGVNYLAKAPNPSIGLQ